MNTLLLAKAIASLGAGGGFIFLAVDHSRDQIQLNKNHRLIDAWNEREENISKVCEGNGDENCRLNRSYIPQYEDGEKWEFLYHEANLDYLLEKVKSKDETWEYPFTQEQIQKIISKSSNSYGVLNSVDVKRRDRGQYEEFGSNEWKRFRKICMIMLENNEEVTNNPSNDGFMCVFDEWSRQDFEKYKLERKKGSRMSNWEVYLKSVSKSKKR